ncbi:type 2 lactosamine alpha-2,3-sialyltransferase isoform X2 [Monodelphis domestica]|uniref:type 2 lactosamine alpha-2,3-sialyltransferase isoform X2 n=1 Tax=Monodelphis domestica TaxID=13616 RepID=UPI0004431B51|nr:type 2 lactosamine alpha-2,3-sialyltransferase isoform X2 [Monodelphis domestica]
MDCSHTSRRQKSRFESRVTSGQGKARYLQNPSFSTFKRRFFLKAGLDKIYSEEVHAGDVLAMRGYLVFLILSSIFLYYILHGILWRESSSWLRVIEMRRPPMMLSCSLKPAFESLLSYRGIYPFLCTSDLNAIAAFQESDKIALPYGVKKSVHYFQLALSRLQSCDLFPETDKVPCKKCIVVGNGAVLKNKTLGEKIDSYDVIIRINDGPVRGYEEDVGTKTTFRIFYPESVFTNPEDHDPDSVVILTVFKSYDLMWLGDLLDGNTPDISHFWKKPALNLIYKTEKIRILDPIITRIAAYDLLHFPTSFPKKEKPKHPTTGIIAITLAFYICHEVHLAGFKYNFTDKSGPLHYYGNTTMFMMSTNEYHNITAEQIFLKNIIEKNFVTDLTQD